MRKETAKPKGDDYAHRIERIERLLCAVALRLRHEEADGVRPKLPLEYYMVGAEDDQQATKAEVAALIKEMQSARPRSDE